MGGYHEIHSYKHKNTKNYTDKVFSFVRWNGDDKLIVVSNFDEKVQSFKLKLDVETLQLLDLKKGIYELTDQLSGVAGFELRVDADIAVITIGIDGLESFILKF